MSGLELALKGYKLTTAEILYRRPTTLLFSSPMSGRNMI